MARNASQANSQTGQSGRKCKAYDSGSGVAASSAHGPTLELTSSRAEQQGSTSCRTPALEVWRQETPPPFWRGTSNGRWVNLPRWPIVLHALLLLAQGGDDPRSKAQRVFSLGRVLYHHAGGRPCPEVLGVAEPCDSAPRTRRARTPGSARPRRGLPSSNRTFVAP